MSVKRHDWSEAIGADVDDDDSTDDVVVDADDCDALLCQNAELLEALKTLVSSIGELERWSPDLRALCDSARSLITKAEGKV